MKKMSFKVLMEDHASNESVRWTVDQKVQREEVDDVYHPLHRPVLALLAKCSMMQDIEVMVVKQDDVDTEAGLGFKRILQDFTYIQDNISSMLSFRKI